MRLPRKFQFQTSIEALMYCILFRLILDSERSDKCIVFYFFCLLNLFGTVKMFRFSKMEIAFSSKLDLVSNLIIIVFDIILSIKKVTTI